MDTPRHVYRHAELLRLFDPRTIALVGASPNPGSAAYLAMLNLRSFGGMVYPVNARHEQIDGKPCYRSLSALPHVPDCVVIAVGREAVEGIIEECAEIGVGGAVIFAAGYAETGKPDRTEQQARIASIARQRGLRVAGPNCVGLLNHASGLAMSFTPSLVLASGTAGAIGLVSQSGGVGNGLTQALHRGIALSHTLSTGNSCDVDCADCISYLAEDPRCKAIALVFEGVASTARLMEAGALAWANDKPLVIFKMGRAALGAEAALSHSGFVAGSNVAYMAAFERIGAIVVDRYEALIETAAFFAKAPPPKTQASGVAVVSASGGGRGSRGRRGRVERCAAAAHESRNPQPGGRAATGIRNGQESAGLDGLAARQPETARLHRNSSWRSRLRGRVRPPRLFVAGGFRQVRQAGRNVAPSRQAGSVELGIRMD